jgi:integrase/recombinase XerD
VRLTAVRGFARYLQTIDPNAELPPRALLPVGTGRRRPTPYIYSEAEITALMITAGRRRPRLSAATLQTLIGLLAVTGMRIGEAIRLDRDHLDLEHRRLVIANSKFGKSRQLPLHPTTTRALRAYLRRRDQLRPDVETRALLITATGKRLERCNVERQFRQLRAQAGLAARPGSRPPRIHDLRHSFAVHTMLDSYRNGGDPVARIAQLATYLGHANPAASYWYLSAAPDLLALAATRLENDPLEAHQ